MKQPKENTMKKLLVILAVLIFSVISADAGTWTLAWSASAGAAGYEVSYKTLAATTYTKVDVGTAFQWVIPATLVKGTRYEFFVQGYVGTPKSYSGDSDHIRWTYPNDPVVIELPAPASSIIINFAP